MRLVLDWSPPVGGAGGMLPAVLQLGESKEREVEVRRWVGAASAAFQRG